MKEITTTEVQERLEKGETLHLVDVREADEVAEGIIPGAIHIPLGEVPTRMEELDKSKPYIFICRSGGRSGRATDFLTEEGYDVTNMVGGMLAWEGATE
ncbi:rhodanese-like domain-containing protein [Sporosarcina sp. ACRSM]|uniref:rhodanese-like domain-containing protein n=1 Tax=Sporosarcina sp. ACRSM TaxID=2918216 RepID=UPI001EF72D51|nr:rhodanese-like domain-containing protein [Sporosarcina sp. ACRSM]MCG7335415.1 rhodanese-like domain-containing protein [Sporosarcina sp. ACRSM]